MKIEVVVTGNRSLYRSICESIDRTTGHRTFTGAARAIVKVEADAKDWARSCGQWGTYTIRIDGRDLSKDDMNYLFCAVEQAIAERKWTDPITKIAALVEQLANN